MISTAVTHKFLKGLNVMLPDEEELLHLQIAYMHDVYGEMTESEINRMRALEGRPPVDRTLRTFH